jgi:hypothetical protein
MKRSCSLRWPLRRRTAASEALRARGPNTSGSGVPSSSCHTSEALSSAEPDVAGARSGRNDGLAGAAAALLDTAASTVAPAVNDWRRGFSALHVTHSFRRFTALMTGAGAGSDCQFQPA